MIFPSVFKTVTILGSTGSVGQQAVDVLLANPGRFQVEALVAGNNAELLIAQAKQLRPKLVVSASAANKTVLEQELKSFGITVEVGDDAVLAAASRPVDICVAGIVGFAGLAPTFAALRAAKRLAFVSKECLVCAGDLFLNEAKNNNCEIIPTDSEHSAIFQLIEAENKSAIDKITLTASGGPFLNFTPDQMRAIKPAQAIAHPVWRMGKKISVDSATLFNKGLEIIEAHYLFGIENEKIDVIIHPEGVIHSMVEYRDGSILAQMGPPDMRLPIAYALFYPSRAEFAHARLDLGKLSRLNFLPPDAVRFPSLNLCRQAMTQKGMAPLTLNTANEIAVDRFLSQDIDFISIFSLVADMLDLATAKSGWSQNPSTLHDMIEFDAWVRLQSRQWQPKSTVTLATA